MTYRAVAIVKSSAGLRKGKLGMETHAESGVFRRRHELRSWNCIYVVLPDAGEAITVGNASSLWLNTLKI